MLDCFVLKLQEVVSDTSLETFEDYSEISKITTFSSKAVNYENYPLTPGDTFDESYIKTSYGYHIRKFGLAGVDKLFIPYVSKGGKLYSIIITDSNMSVLYTNTTGKLQNTVIDLTQYQDAAYLYASCSTGDIDTHDLNVYKVLPL